eukprot:3922381-Amphidinium_carterae.1
MVAESSIFIHNTLPAIHQISKLLIIEDSQQSLEQLPLPLPEDQANCYIWQTYPCTPANPERLVK